MRGLWGMFLGVKLNLESIGMVFKSIRVKIRKLLGNLRIRMLKLWVES